MNQKKVTAAAVLILCFFFFFLGEIQGNERDDQKPPFSDTLRRKFSNSAENLKILLNQAHAYFIPPNLDFRGNSIPREEASKEKMMEGGGGAPEHTLKEAVSESLGKTKATVEESAKSAADLATKTIRESTDKVKRSLSSPHSTEDGDEL